MRRFKRNQIEEALSGTFGEQSRKPSSELRTRVKRLLDTDRGLGRNKRSSDPERANYAFFSDDSPGKGIEIWFSEYEAFAILLGLQLMGHGWPQTFAVSVLRSLRPELESQHSRILKQDPAMLFDKEEILRNVREGDLGFDNSDPVILTILSKRGATRGGQNDPLTWGICRGHDELVKFVRKAGADVGAFTTFELVNVAHELSKSLAETEPRRRGRST